MEETRLICCCCDAELTENTAYRFEDDIYCEECMDEYTTTCDHCGAVILRDNAHSDSNTTLCQECYYDYYYTCEDCGCIIRNNEAYYLDNDEEYPYCYSCYQRNQRYRGIHNYYYKPDPIFYGDSDRYFGIELEVDEGGCVTSNAEDVLCIANNDHDDRLYIKSDGSIDDGFELVTHPMSLEYHINTMPWFDIMDTLIDLGYLSHKTSTCGLHCHVNRSAFGITLAEQDAAISRVIYFVEHHWDEMLRFSRRTEGQMQQWASRYGMKNKPSELMDDIKKTKFDRYKCINLQNNNTIEFRMFRGTLKHSTFIATLQLINEICNVAVLLSDEEMTELTWESFLENIDKDKNPELFAYLKKRNLYTEKGV